ncbi:hypothetical protein FHL15_003947 [Xylaria flabelliformis]|uniref:Uncharacterized protein n=1 Tax=Xylaria flabelliformis TaxID=2512241 RepID=A0A553I4Y8_9PEZI|nr:hypothetical protein FHL15_003947 [Xylaria flabelliformis]
MAPPPATPTPHRFLVPKRSQPHSETPSSQQFHATPRFTLHSTQRTGPSSSLTPFRHRATGRDVLIESSPPPLPSVDDVDDNEHGKHDHVYPGERYEQGYVKYDQDSVIDEDNVVQTSSPIRGVENDSEDDDRDEEKRIKRRRVSSSPSDIKIEESYSLPEREFELDVQMRDAVSDVESSFTEPSILEDDMVSDEGVLEHDTGESSARHREKRPLKSHQPTFQKAPRFKPSEIPEGAPHPEPLPDVFSPRRRGAKYVQGGLAAELRDWLVDVEAGTGSGLSTSVNAKRNEEWVMRIRVDGLHGMNKSARGMTVVVGRQVLDKKNDASDDDRGQNERENAVVEVLGSSTIRIILAGPGRLSGLGIGNDVRLGVLLGIARPTWEVVLDGLGRFGVACDWVVLR